MFTSNNPADISKKQTSGSETKHNTSAKVYDILLEKITSGEYKPGDKFLSENQLKQELGVSRITIREALQKLAALNLIETKQGKGSVIKAFSMDDYLNMPFTVTKPGYEDIVHLIEYRKILEYGAIRLCIENAQPGDTELLTKYTKMMGNNLSDFETYAYYDSLFHHKLLQMTGNPLIESAGNTIRELTEKAIKYTITPEGTAEGVIVHTQIIQAIVQKDIDSGEKAVEKILDYVALAAKERMGKEI